MSTKKATQYFHWECGGPAFPVYYRDGQHTRPVRLRGAFYCPSCDRMVRVPNVQPASQMKRLVARGR